jgi:hypothetical protein
MRKFIIQLLYILRTPDPAQITLSQFLDIKQRNNLICSGKIQHYCTPDIIFATIMFCAMFFINNYVSAIKYSAGQEF